jgi:hypothetical protein
LTSQRSSPDENVVWQAKPWITPAAALRTVTVFIVTILFIFLEIYTSVAFHVFFGLPLWAWTTLIFIIIWLISITEMLIFRLSNTYVLRQDGLETRKGIIRLRSFVVTPSGFGDLLVYQSIGGRIFGYGEITVNSQGERQTKLVLVRSPFDSANTIRDIMGKPIVRVANPT